MTCTTQPTLCFLVLFSVFLKPLVLAEDAVNQFIYNGFNGANLHLDGIAKIQSSGLLQLTNSSKQQVGHAFYPIPISFNTTSSSKLPQSTVSFLTYIHFYFIWVVVTHALTHTRTHTPKPRFWKIKYHDLYGLSNHLV